MTCQHSFVGVSNYFTTVSEEFLANLLLLCEKIALGFVCGRNIEYDSGTIGTHTVSALSYIKKGLTPIYEQSTKQDLAEMHEGKINKNVTYRKNVNKRKNVNVLTGKIQLKKKQSGLS